MAENIRGIMVTEEMLVEAAQVGDLESLMIWARQGVRVTTAEPLLGAGRCHHLEVMRCLVQELGADVKQAPSGYSPLLMAVAIGNLAMVRLLVMDLGADINQGDQGGATPLIMAASAR